MLWLPFVMAPGTLLPAWQAAWLQSKMLQHEGAPSGSAFVSGRHARPLVDCFPGNSQCDAAALTKRGSRGRSPSTDRGPWRAVVPGRRYIIFGNCCGCANRGAWFFRVARAGSEAPRKDGWGAGWLKRRESLLAWRDAEHGGHRIVVGPRGAAGRLEPFGLVLPCDRRELVT